MPNNHDNLQAVAVFVIIGLTCFFGFLAASWIPSPLNWELAVGSLVFVLIVGITYFRSRRVVTGNIEIQPKWSGGVGNSNNSRHMTLGFSVFNNGKDTATNLRGEIFAGLRVPNSQILADNNLKMKSENSDEWKDKVTLSYRDYAEIPSVLDFLVTQTNEGLKYSYRGGTALGVLQSGTRICDISVYLYAEGGDKASYKVWLIGTGDWNEPFKFEKMRFRDRYKFLMSYYVRHFGLM